MQQQPLSVSWSQKTQNYPNPPHKKIKPTDPLSTRYHLAKQKSQNRAKGRYRPPDPPLPSPAQTKN